MQQEARPHVYMTAGLLPALGLIASGLVAPTVMASVAITIIGSVVAIAVIGSVVAITISMAVIATAIMSPGVSVVVGNLFDCRVRDSGTIQGERGHGGVGWAGTR